jgi:hypothetical protein
MNTARNRGQASIVVIILIILVIAGIALYLFHTPSAPATTGTATTTQTTSGTNYTDPSTWQNASSDIGAFTISYPTDFAAENAASVATSTNWRLDSQNPGVLAFTLTVPKSFQPQTNFSEAKLTVGYSANATAVKNCYMPLASASTSQISTTTINGVAFQQTTTSDAGAGNLYDTTSYRTIHANTCYTIEYTIHSTQLANYPESAGITAFDQGKVTQVLNLVVNTFRFK